MCLLSSFHYPPWSCCIKPHPICIIITTHIYALAFVSLPLSHLYISLLHHGPFRGHLLLLVFKPNWYLFCSNLNRLSVFTLYPPFISPSRKSGDSALDRPFCAWPFFGCSYLHFSRSFFPSVSEIRAGPPFLRKSHFWVGFPEVQRVTHLTEERGGRGGVLLESNILLMTTRRTGGETIGRSCLCPLPILTFLSQSDLVVLYQSTFSFAMTA